MSWWRRDDALDWDIVNNLIDFLMRMDAKLDRILAAVEDDDEDDE